MTVRTLPFPSYLVRWFVVPATLMAMVAAAASLLHRRTRAPAMPKMSDEWLHNFDRARHDLDWW